MIERDGMPIDCWELFEVFGGFYPRCLKKSQIEEFEKWQSHSLPWTWGQRCKDLPAVSPNE
jgi:hypothetical protein